jgi:hypothetical protein
MEEALYDGVVRENARGKDATILQLAIRANVENADVRLIRVIDI